MGASQSKNATAPQSKNATSGENRTKPDPKDVKAVKAPPASHSTTKASNNKCIKQISLQQNSDDSSGGNKDLVIAFNDDMSEVEVHHEKHGSKRRMSRLDKLKSRKLPHSIKLQIIGDEEEEHHHEKHRRGSEHHMSHLEKIKRRKMPVGQRIFGEHYNLE